MVLQKSPALRGALGASLVTHALFAWLLYLLITHPVPASRLADESRHAFAGLVWLDRSGPGGGGGGGGNRSLDPPRKLETRGSDAMAMPVAHAKSFTAPNEIPKEHETPVMALVLPVQPMDAGQLAAAGVLQNANLAPTTSQGSGSESGAGKGRRGGSGDGDGNGLDRGLNGGYGGDIYEIGNGVTSPVLVHEVKPQYTPDAMRARIQGEVLVSAIVGPDGTVSRLRVVRSLDSTFGLDDQALNAVRHWRFKPATRAGQPVAVQIQIAVGFAMR